MVVVARVVVLGTLQDQPVEGAHIPVTTKLELALARDIAVEAPPVPLLHGYCVVAELSS